MPPKNVDKDQVGVAVQLEVDDGATSIVCTPVSDSTWQLVIT